MRAKRGRGATGRSAIVMAAFVAVILSADSAEAQRGRIGGGGPTIDAETSGAPRIEGSAVAFTVAVRIPAGHHGYVDRGDEGFYIPFSFSFPGLSESGVESAVVSRPEGVRDDEVKAFVLRGRGEFGLELSPAEKLSGMDEVEASLRYQICNDLTGVCYPPRRLTIEVPLPG